MSDKMSEMIHALRPTALHSAHIRFPIACRRGHLRQKPPKLLAAGALPLQTADPTANLQRSPCWPPSWWRGARYPLPQNQIPTLSPPGFEHRPLWLRPVGPRNWGSLTYCLTRATQSLAIHATACLFRPLRNFWHYIVSDRILRSWSNVCWRNTTPFLYRQTLTT